MKHTVIVYHKSSEHVFCDDGFTAAFAAWLIFGDQAEYLPAIHGQPFDCKQFCSKFSGWDVYFLDFSYPVDIMDRIEKAANRLVVLDHHKMMVDAFQGRTYADHSTIAHSGAVIAWHYFHDSRYRNPPPMLFQYVQDNDLWHHRLFETRLIIQKLRLEPYDFENWQKIMAVLEDQTMRQTFIEEGRLLLRQIQVMCDALEKNAFMVTLNGVQGLAVNANRFCTNELGERLSKTCGTFGAVFMVNGDRMADVSLRSSSDDCDVSKIAITFGGGGHPRAAGFRAPLNVFWPENSMCDLV